MDCCGMDLLGAGLGAGFMALIFAIVIIESVLKGIAAKVPKIRKKIPRNNLF